MFDRIRLGALTLNTADLALRFDSASHRPGGELDQTTRRRPSRLLALPAILLTCTAIGAEPFSASSSRTIISPIDESQLIQLAGNTRFEARAANDRGRVDDSMVLRGIQLQLKRSPSQEAAAEQLADEVNKPGSAHFHQWLTADEYAQQLGVSLEDIATISGWLSRHGLQVDELSPSRMTINFSGTAGQIREAFHSEIHELSVGGKQHLANMGDPWIPEALAPAIEGIVSLHDFRPHTLSVAKAARPAYTYGPIPAGYQLLVPADVATIYNINPVFNVGFTGKGETIAFVEDTDMYSEGDWTTFRTTFGLSGDTSGSLTTIHPGGCADPGVTPNGDDFKAALDAEYATATAPGATLELAACDNTSTTSGVLIALQNLLNERHTPSVISVSYAACEPENGQAGNAAIKIAYLQALLEGISVFVASGDTGAAGCDLSESGADTEAVFGLAVSALTSTPYDVSVGGTDFGDLYFGTVANYWSNTNSATYGSALSYVPEITWNDSCASSLNASFFGFSYSYGADGFCNNPYAPQNDVVYLLTWAGGGGPSSCATGVPTGGSNSSSIVGGSCRGYAKPWWQNATGNPDDGVRDVPDIAMFASNGIWGHYLVVGDSDPTPGANGAPCVGDPINWAGGGGTSFAAPMMAGIQALVNQKWGGRQGNPNPVYYALAQQDRQNHLNCSATAKGGPSPECIFHDITLGNTDVDCVPPNNCYDPGNSANVPLSGVLSTSNSRFQPAYTATPGWDLTAGLGSVDAERLVSSPAWRAGVP
jgi:subtilase family serine protease